MQLPLERPPLALIACSDDWMSRALESVFQQHGYVMLHTRSGVQTMELARLANHDLLILDESLSDMRAIDVCRALRDGGQYDHSVPVVITSPTPINRRLGVLLPSCRSRAGLRQARNLPQSAQRTRCRAIRGFREFHHRSLHFFRPSPVGWKARGTRPQKA